MDEKVRDEVEEITRAMMCLTSRRAQIRKNATQREEFSKKNGRSSNEGRSYGKILCQMYFK